MGSVCRFAFATVTGMIATGLFAVGRSAAGPLAGMVPLAFASLARSLPSRTVCLQGDSQMRRPSISTAVPLRARRGTAAAALVAVALASGFACTRRDQIRIETQAAKSLISDEQENAIGLQVSNDLGKEHLKYIQDPQIEAYVSSITSKIFSLAEKDRPGVKWHVHVIDDAKTVNAFAVPGGHLFVYSGLLLAAENDAEVAGVLAHETGHVVARHSARQMVDAYGLQAIAALATGQNPTLLEQIATKVAGTGLLLAHSRSEETEADEYGARYSNAAGFDPHGLTTFCAKLVKTEGKQPQAMAWLSDHPLTPDRISKVNAYIAKHHLTATGKNPAAHAAIKARIQQLAPAAADIHNVVGH